jgi:hypothetical protein
MNLLHVESLFIGLKEGLKILLILFLTRDYLIKEDKMRLFISLPMGITVVFFAALSLAFIENSSGYNTTIIKLMGYSFGIFYILSLLFLYQYSGIELFGPLKRYLLKDIFLFPVSLILTVLYFAPDAGGTVLYLKEMVRLSEGNIPVISFFAGLLSVFLLLYLTGRTIKGGLKEKFVGLFDLPQFFLFLALVKLLAGGVKGFAELSLIPVVQAGLMKLIHDVVHQTFITIMVPDHMILSVTTWNFIGALFSERFALYLSLVVLFLPLFVFLRGYMRAPVELPDRIKVKAERRKYVKAVKDQRIWKAVPVISFMIIILFMWFSQREERVSRLYNPEPQPLVAENNEVVIPISSLSGDLRDGMLHKFTVDIDGAPVRLLVMKRSDEGLAVCLDACEICPPQGYAQAEGHVVCLYCRTPIPIDTLGKPGGCNPIPLSAVVTDKDIRIKLSEIKKKWEMVKTGKTREVLK